MVESDVTPPVVWGLEQQCSSRALEISQELKSPALASEYRLRIDNELGEILRTDFPTFCAMLLRVKPKGGGFTQPFLFNNSQRIVWSEMCEMMAANLGVFLVVLKFRQAGISTFICAWLFWQAWRQKDILGISIAHSKKTAENMIETMRVFYDELPATGRVKPRLREGNRAASLPRGEMYFADRRSGVILHIADNLDPRGTQATHVHESEFSSYPNPNELNGALIPQLPARGTPGRRRSSFIIESTPKGQNAFYDIYMRGKDPKSEWRSVFLPWFVQEEEYSLPLPAGEKLSRHEKALRNSYTRLRQEIDGRDVTDEQMYWRRAFIDDEYAGDEDRFAQEFPSDDRSCFLLLSENLFKGDMRYLNECVRESADRAVLHWKTLGHPVSRAPHCRISYNAETRKSSYELDPRSNWVVWETPQKNHVYSMGADVCEGLGNRANDNSAAWVFDITEGRQVAEYAKNIKPEAYAAELNAAGRWYNNALMVPEVNKLGYVVLKQLIQDFAYPNLYRWPKWDEVNRYTHKRGWETNARTKTLMMSALVSYIEDHAIEIASADTLSELSTFQQIGDEYEASSGQKDDRVMAMAMALMGMQQTPKLAAVFNSTKDRVPSAFALGISAINPAEQSPLPQPLQEKVDRARGNVIPWNPIEMDF